MERHGNLLERDSLDIRLQNSDREPRPVILLALSAFDDTTHRPEPSALEATLGKSARAWARLIAEMAKVHGPIDEVWNFAGAKFGWSLRLKRNDRILLYLIPQAGQFLVGVILGEKAVKAARASDLPAEILELIEAARPYAEGRGIRFPAKRKSDVDTALRLVALKVA